MFVRMDNTLMFTLAHLVVTINVLALTLFRFFPISWNKKSYERGRTMFHIIKTPQELISTFPQYLSAW